VDKLQEIILLSIFKMNCKIRYKFNRNNNIMGLVIDNKIKFYLRMIVNLEFYKALIKVKLIIIKTV
jgi:hypothetical protein